MKFLKINTNPSAMIKDFLYKYPELDSLHYDEIINNYLNEYYWPSNSLEKSLHKLYDWKCTTLISALNNTPQEAGIFFNKWSQKYNQKYLSDDFFDKLLYQILYHNPDIVYIHEIWQYPQHFIFNIKYLLKDVTILGWNCSIKSKYKLNNLKYSDIVYTCSLEIKSQMQKNGIFAKHIGHAFDSDVLKKLTHVNKLYDVIFIGSLIDPIHVKRVEFLKYLLNKGIDVTIFGDSDDPLLKQHCKKPLFGIDLYKVYKASKIVLNAHASDDIRYSGNIRMYEVTGVGSFLLSDFKEDMKDIFILDKEVITYNSFEEASKQIQYFLSNDTKKKAIAKAGHERTLQDYTFTKIAKEVYNSIQELKQISKEELYSKIIHKQKDNNYLFSLQINSFFKKFQELNLTQNKFILYGYGSIGKIVYMNYKNNIAYIADAKHTDINIDTAIDPKEIIHLDSSLDIFISVLGREKEIKTFLLSEGISENRIKTLYM